MQMRPAPDMELPKFRISPFPNQVPNFPNFQISEILLYFLYNYLREEISLSFHKCLNSLVLRSCGHEKVYQLVNNMQSVEGFKILQILEFAIYQCSWQTPDFQNLAALQRILLRDEM